MSAVVWVCLAVCCGVRLWGIAGSFFWQDDYIHIWTAWNAPATDLIWQNWNGHREPASFAVQWALARAAPQVWWPAAVVLAVIAVATPVMFWLMLRRWGGVTPATASAAILFAAWPATAIPQQWLSAGLETVPLLLTFIAGWLMARPGRWTPLWVGLLAVLAWGFHERAVYMLPVLFAIAVFYGRWRDNRVTWWVLAGVTALGLLIRLGDARPGQTGGASIPGSLWYAGPGSVLRSVLGWLPFDAHTVVPVNVGLWGLVVLVIWMALLIAGLETARRQTLLVAGVTVAFLVVEVLSFVLLRGGFAGSQLASDPRFTLITGTVLLAGLGSFDITWRPVVAVAAVLGVLGCWSMLRYPPAPGRDWFTPLPAGTELAATPSPPQMLGHFFFTTQPPVYELGTTRTLLQVGPEPPAFPQVSQNPQQVGPDGRLGPMTYTPLLTDPRRQCGRIEVPAFDAGVRVVELLLTKPGRVNGVAVDAGQVFVFPPAGPVSVRVEGCTDGVTLGTPGR